MFFYRSKTYQNVMKYCFFHDFDDFWDTKQNLLHRNPQILSFYKGKTKKSIHFASSEYQISWDLNIFMRFEYFQVPRAYFSLTTWLFCDPKTIKTHEAVGKKWRFLQGPYAERVRVLFWWVDEILEFPRDPSTGSEFGIKNDDFPSKIRFFSVPDLIIISKYCSVIL